MAEPTFSIEEMSSVEGGLVTFTVKLSEAPTDAVTVDYQVLNGTAVVGYPFDVTEGITQGGPISGTLTFAPNQDTQTITLLVANDTLDELDESFFLELTNPQGASFEGGNQSLQAVAFALDDDGVGVNRTLAISNPTVVEGNGRQAEFTITLSESFATATTLTYSTYDGSAQAGSDYVAQSGIITFAAGQTEATVMVNLLDDGTVEAGESFGLKVNGVSGVTGSVGEAAVLNDDGSVPILSIEGMSQVEGGFVTFTLKLSEMPTDAVTVDYQVLNGTAVVGYPFDVTEGFATEGPISGTRTFAPGQDTQTITLFMGTDTLDELDESFFVELTNPQGASFGGGNQTLQAIGWALDDDGVGVNRTLAVSNPTVAEEPGAFAVFSVELSQPSTTAITINYETVGQSATSGSDFVATQGSITFAPGQTHAEIRVPITSDTPAETAESFTLNLLPPYPVQVSGATGGVSGHATILDYALRGTSDGETLTGSNSAERIEAYGGNDRLLGNGGADLLYGGDGQDTLEGGSGLDTMYGGAGNDLYVVDAATDRVIESVNEGIDLVTASVGFTLGADIENLTLTGAGNLKGLGNASANVIVGNAGDNKVQGLDGGDSLFGGAGDDRLDGGRDDDVITGGAGRDILTGGGSRDVFVFTAVSDSLAGDRDKISDFTAKADLIDLSAIDADEGRNGNQTFHYIRDQAFSGDAGELRMRNGLIQADTDGDGTADFEISVADADVLTASSFDL